MTDPPHPADATTDVPPLSSLLYTIAGPKADFDLLGIICDPPTDKGETVVALIPVPERAALRHFRDGSV